MLAWKLRIVVLWISLTVCQTASTYLVLLQPGALRELTATGRLLGQDVRSPAVQVGTLLYWLVPMLLAFLTLVLDDTENRRTNAWFGGGGALYQVSTFVPPQGGTSAAGLVIGVVAVLVPLLVLWHAWKWPRRNEVSAGRS